MIQIDTFAWDNKDLIVVNRKKGLGKKVFHFDGFVVQKVTFVTA